MFITFYSLRFIAKYWLSTALTFAFSLIVVYIMIVFNYGLNISNHVVYPISKIALILFVSIYAYEI